VEAARRIKSLNIPIIYLTGQNDEVLIKRAMETVPYALLKKPVKNGVLQEKIRSAREDQELRMKKMGRK
jgi:1,2-diacylglycerol 3-beta-glucosyltransferase